MDHANHKREERAATRATRKEYRVKQQAQIKLHRANKDFTPQERRMAIGGTRAFHKIGKDGKPGGFLAFSAYAAKNSEKHKKQAERQAKVTANRATRVAKASALKTSRASMNVKRRETSAYKKNDIQFYKINAKNRGMSLPDYYAKYVQNR